MYEIVKSKNGFRIVNKITGMKLGYYVSLEKALIAKKQYE